MRAGVSGLRTTLSALALATGAVTAVQASTPTVAWTAHGAGGSGLANGQPACGTSIIAGAGKQAIAVDGAGNTYVAGCATNGSGNDFVTVKYDASGVVQWTKRLHGTGVGAGQAIALKIDGSGNIVVAGNFDNSGSGGTTNDLAVVKYDSTGAQQWLAAYASTSAVAIDLDGSGNAYVTGIQSTNGNDFVTLKFAAATGAKVWAQTFNGAAGLLDNPSAIVVDGAGNVYVAGKTGVTAGFPAICDAVVIKYDNNGNMQWTRTYDGGIAGGKDDAATSIAVDASGNVYIAGYVGQTAGSDMLAIKFDASGTQQWVQTFHGPNAASTPLAAASAIAVDASGTVYVTGYVNNATPNFDYATLAYDASGNLIWSKLFDGAGAGTDKATTLLLDGAGKVWVLGTSTNNSTAKNNDYVLISYATADGTPGTPIAYNGPDDKNDTAMAMALDAAGNIYVTGYSQDAGSANHFATAKYTSAGAQAWATRDALPETGFIDLFSDGNNTPASRRALATDPQGNLYVTGKAHNGNNYDFETTKYDKTGAPVWVARYNGPFNRDDIPVALAVDASGNVFVTGTTTTNATNGNDILTVKYDANGVQQWTKTYNNVPTNGSDVPVAIGVDGSGNVYVAGTSAGSGTGNDYVTIKYSAAGTQQWAARFNGQGTGNDAVTAMAVDTAGNVFVTGTMTNAAFNTDYATIKYDTNGSAQWTQYANNAATYDGGVSGADAPSAIALDASGNVYVTGTSSGGSGAGQTRNDFYTIKYDTNGNSLWAQRYTGTGALVNSQEAARTITLDATGNVYVAGTTTDASNTTNFAIVKYDAAGNLQWGRALDGGVLPTPKADVANEIAVDAIGNVYVTGTFTNAANNVDFATAVYDANGNLAGTTTYDGSAHGTDNAVGLVLSPVDATVVIAGTDNQNTSASHQVVMKLYPAAPIGVTVMPAAPAVVGQPYSVSASVAAGMGTAPSGSVSFSDGQGASCGPVAAVANVASCMLSSTAAGAHTITATFTPDAPSVYYSAGTGTAAQTVNQAATTVAITTHTPDPSLPAAAVTVSASVAVVSPGSGTPTGTINVTDGTDSCTITLPATSCDVALGARGAHTLTASYAGDANFTGSTSAGVTHHVNQLPVANADNYSVAENGTLTVAAAQGVLANDSDADTGQTLVVANSGSLTADGIGGSVTLNADGSFSFTPPADTIGSASFSYTVSDGLESSIGTVTISVSLVNHAPSFTIGSVAAWPAGATGLKTQPGFASVTSFGPANESGQAVQAWLTQVTDPNGVVNGLQVQNDGTLVYSLTGKGGTASVSVALQDNGGTANGGVDTAPAQTFSITVGNGVDLKVTMDGAKSFLSGGSLADYTIVVQNIGSNDATGATVQDSLPSNLTGASWTCFATGGGHCAGSGNGAINDTVNVPKNAVLIYSLSATVMSMPEGPVSNTATVTAAAGQTDLDTSNNSVTMTEAVGVFADGFDGLVATPVAHLAVSAQGGTQTATIDTSHWTVAAIGATPQLTAVLSGSGERAAAVHVRQNTAGKLEVRLSWRDDDGVWVAGKWSALASLQSLTLGWHSAAAGSAFELDQVTLSDAGVALDSAAAPLTH
jgi:uncharacterized repeat protein (TIGR01451 family)/uncharacterized delta-60 repeat protein